jgi:hypothetical protein
VILWICISSILGCYTERLLTRLDTPTIRLLRFRRIPRWPELDDGARNSIEVFAEFNTLKYGFTRKTQLLADPGLWEGCLPAEMPALIWS